MRGWLTGCECQHSTTTQHGTACVQKGAEPSFSEGSFPNKCISWSPTSFQLWEGVVLGSYRSP